MFSKTLVSTFTMAWALLLLLGVLVQERFQPILHVSAFQGMNKIGPRTTPFAFTGTIQKSVVQHLSSSTSLFSEVTSAPNKSVVDASDSTSTSSQRTTTGSHTPFTNPKSNQPKYGKELDLPHTYVRCGRCFTNYALTEEDLGTGKGRRVECSLCSHSWFQTPERLFTLNQGHQLVPLPETEITRIHSNVENGREPDYVGNTKFYVGNLDFGVQEDDLRQVFQEIGQVGGVSIVTDPNGRSRGFAFVTMMDEEVTEKCMNLDGFELMGRNINVKAPNN